MEKSLFLSKLIAIRTGSYLLQSFPVCRGIFPRHILKEAAESTHTFKAQNHRYFFDAMRGMQQQPFRFGHHSFLYNLQRGRHTVCGK